MRPGASRPRSAQTPLRTRRSGGTCTASSEGRGRGSASCLPRTPPVTSVKVVQRVPVRIVFDEPPDAQYPPGAGMSVVATVRVKWRRPADPGLLRAVPSRNPLTTHAVGPRADRGGGDAVGGRWAHGGLD